MKQYLNELYLIALALILSGILVFDAVQKVVPSKSASELIEKDNLINRLEDLNDVLQTDGITVSKSSTRNFDFSFANPDVEEFKRPMLGLSISHNSVLISFKSVDKSINCQLTYSEIENLSIYELGKLIDKSAIEHGYNLQEQFIVKEIMDLVFLEIKTQIKDDRFIADLATGLITLFFMLFGSLSCFVFQLLNNSTRVSFRFIMRSMAIAIIANAVTTTAIMLFYMKSQLDFWYVWGIGFFFGFFWQFVFATIVAKFIHWFPQIIDTLGQKIVKSLE